MIYNKDIFEGDTPIATSIGSQYIITGFVWLNDDPTNNQFLSKLYFKPIGFLESELQSFIFLDSTSPTGQWIELSTIFTATDTTTLIGLHMEYTNEGTNVTGNVDDITIQGPIINLSELKTVDVNQSCTNQEILLAWINYNGEVETWNFTARKGYGIEFGQVQQFRKDITADWPNNFVDGDTEDDYTSIEAFDTLTVVSQFLTLQQINAIKWVKVSKDVYRLDGSKPKRVLVDKNSFTIRQDNDKLFQIEFTIRSTERLPVQTA